MVQKIVAGVGALLSAVGVILLIVVSVTEDFVIVTIPGDGSSCDEDTPFGTLGVFTATLDPACAQASSAPEMASYAGLEKAETPTTEFWPLFPAQQGYGSALPGGAEAPDFTNCEEFYAEGGEMEAVAATLGTLNVLNGLNDTMVSSYAETELLRNVGLNLHGTLQTIAARAYVDGIQDALEGLQPSAQAVVGYMTFLWASFDGACTTADDTLTLTVYSACPTGGASLTAATISGPSLADLIADEADPSVVTPVFSAALYTAMEAALGLDVGTGPATSASLAFPVNLHVDAGLINGASLRSAAATTDVLGGVAAFDLTDNTTDFSSVLLSIGTIQAAVPPAEFPASFGLVLQALGICGSDAGTSISSQQECFDARAQLISPAPPDLDDVTVLPFCLAARETGALPVPPAAPCVYFDIVSALGVVPLEQLQALLSTDPTFADAAADLTEGDVAQLLAFIGGCEAQGLSLPTCTIGALEPPLIGGNTITADEQAWGIPSAWDATTVALCNLLPPGSCTPNSDFRGFVAYALTTFNLSTPEGLQSFGAIQLVINGACAAANSVPQCIGAVQANPSAVRPLVEAVFSQLSVPSESDEDVEAGEGPAARLAACEDDDKDQEIFEQAQAMLPAAMALAGLGVVLAAVGAALNKTAVAVVAGVFSIVGGALTIGALLLIRTAPVYELVGGEEVDYEPLYSASGGQILALVGGVLPLLGGVAMAVSALLNRPGSSSEMTSKVDNTY